jgi:hypothetical protein
MSNSYIPIKVLNDRNAGETPTQDVSLAFPFVYDKNSLTQYRAQLFYAPTDTLNNISIGIAKGDYTTAGEIRFDIRAYDSGAANKGLDSTPISAVSVINIDTELPLYEQYSETLYLTQNIPLTTVNLLNTSNQTLSVTAGNWYWIVMDLGKSYNKVIDGFITPNLYFLMSTPGFSAIGNPNTTSYSLTKVQDTTLFNPAPVKSTNVDWSLTDDVRDHIILVNDSSLIRFGYSLNNTDYNYATWDDAISDGELYDTLGWQVYGLYDISITNPLYGGTNAYGSKTIYTRFYRKLGSLYQTSSVISSNIEYNAYTPIVTEVVGIYTKLWN